MPNPALVLLVHKRPQYYEQVIDAICKLKAIERFTFYVSIDQSDQQQQLRKRLESLNAKCSSRSLHSPLSSLTALSLLYATTIPHVTHPDVFRSARFTRAVERLGSSGASPQFCCSALV